MLDAEAHHGGAGELTTLPLSPVTVPGYVVAQGTPIAYDDAGALPADQPFRNWATRQPGALLSCPVTNFQDAVIAVAELGRGPQAGPFPTDLLPTPPAR